MTDEALIEELARVMCKRVVHDDIEALELDWHLWVEDARAILPIIRRREIEAGEKVKAAVHTEAVNHGVTNTSFAQEDDGWINDMDPSYIRGQGLLEFARKTIRALDVAAIIGDSHD